MTSLSWEERYSLREVLLQEMRKEGLNFPNCAITVKAFLLIGRLLGNIGKVSEIAES